MIHFNFYLQCRYYVKCLVIGHWNQSKFIFFLWKDTPMLMNDAWSSKSFISKADFQEQKNRDLNWAQKKLRYIIHSLLTNEYSWNFDRWFVFFSQWKLLFWVFSIVKIPIVSIIFQQIRPTFILNCSQCELWI